MVLVEDADVLFAGDICFFPKKRPRDVIALMPGVQILRRVLEVKCQGIGLSQ